MKTFSTICLFITGSLFAHAAAPNTLRSITIRHENEAFLFVIAPNEEKTHTNYSVRLVPFVEANEATKTSEIKHNPVGKEVAIQVKKHTPNGVVLNTSIIEHEMVISKKGASPTFSKKEYPNTIELQLGETKLIPYKGEGHTQAKLSIRLD